MSENISSLKIDKKISLSTCFSIPHSHLGQITEVITLHFQVKYFGLGVTGFCDQKFV